MNNQLVIECQGTQKNWLTLFGKSFTPKSQIKWFPEKVTRNKKVKDRLFKILGAKKRNHKFNFKDAKRLIVYGNGPWSPEASKFIKNMLSLGYPAKKMLFYRDGLQGWKILGLTTVAP